MKNPRRLTRVEQTQDFPEGLLLLAVFFGGSTLVFAGVAAFMFGFTFIFAGFRALMGFLGLFFAESGGGGGNKGGNCDQGDDFFHGVVWLRFGFRELFDSSLQSWAGKRKFHFGSCSQVIRREMPGRRVKK